MIALQGRSVLIGLLWLALVSACAPHTPPGAPSAYINKENPAPKSQASYEAIRLCNTEIDPALLEVTKGGKRTENWYNEGLWYKIPFLTLLAVGSMGQAGGPEIYEEVCSDECRRARLEIPSQFNACMNANGGWIPCWRGSSGRWVCQRKP